SGAPIEDMVAAPDGTFYVIWGGSHQLRRYDPTTGVVTPLLDNVSGRIAIARDGAVYNAHDYGLERLLPTRQTLIPLNTLSMIPDSFAIKPDGTLLLGGGNCNPTLSMLSYLPNGARRTTILPNQTPGACLW